MMKTSWSDNTSYIHYFGNGKGMLFDHFKSFFYEMKFFWKKYDNMIMFGCIIGKQGLRLTLCNFPKNIVESNQQIMNSESGN